MTWNALPVVTHKIRVVLDTSILVSAALQGVQAEYALRLIQRRVIAGYTSATILKEMDDTLRKKFQQTVEQRTDFQDYLLTILTPVEPAPLKAPKRLRDPGDIHVLATAVAAQADLLVTLDRDLLILGRYKSIGIIHPKTLFWTFPDSRPSLHV